MRPSIRTATSDDIPAVLLLWREAGTEPSRTDDPRTLKLLMERDPAALIVAEEDGRVVGSVIAGWDGWRGSVYRLAVRPSHRHRGLARTLVREAERRLSSVGAVRLQAIVTETGDQAISFWQSSDWDEQVERTRFVKG